MVDSSSRALKRAITATVLLCLGLAVWAPAAGAHAALESTTPTSGEVLAMSPPEIVLEFDEPVEVGLGGVRLHDEDGEQVDPGAQVEVSGTRVVLPLGPLEDGSYVVTYRAVSADSHPVNGALTFRVGEGTIGEETVALADELLAAQGGSAVVGALYAATRAVVFGAMALLTGMFTFVVVISPAVLARRRARILLWGAWGTLAGATALSIGLQGLAASGLPFGEITDPSLWSAVIDTRFGSLAVVRLVLLAGVVPLIVHALRLADGRAPGVWWRVSVLLASVGLYLTVALAGHAESGRWVPFAVTSDVLHLAAMSVWLGGLAALLALVLTRQDSGDHRSAVRRYSTVAFACVIVLVVTGVFQSWRQVGDVDALTSTTYGQVLLVKLGVVVGLVAVAAFSRTVVKHQWGPVADPETEPGADVTVGAAADVGRLRTSVVIEVGLGAIVLVVTALLVNLVPAIDALEAPFATQLTEEELTVDFVVDPAATGAADVHIYTLGETGTPVEVEDVLVDFSLAADDIGPLSVPMTRAGEGHFVAQAFELPIAGEWTAEIRVLPTEFESVVFTADVPVD